MSAYTPNNPPTDPDELPQYLIREFQRIQDAINNVEAESVDVEIVHLVTLYAEPARPTDGDLVFADGTTWNPGNGRGAYIRESGAWVKV